MLKLLLPGGRLRGFGARHRRLLTLLGMAAVFALGFFLNWAISDRGAAPQPAAPEGESPEHAEHAGMDHAEMDRAASLRRLTISPEARALMNIETAPVERRYVTNVVRMVGKIDYDETRVKRITAWVPGRLDRLFVDFTGVPVDQGDHLVWIYSEELYAAQQELIEAAKSAKERKGDRPRAVGGVDLLASAREKLRLLGLKPEQIREIEQQDKPSDHMTIYAPISGTVIRKLRQEGDRVQLGDPIYTVADLSQVWMKMDAYESDLVWLRYGQPIAFTTEAYPGEKFTGRIAFIDPVLDETTRTAKVRVNVPNDDRKLKPEMFAHAEVRAQVATGGRVMDPAMIDKWICKMHPEVVQDEAGKCPTCEMKLVTTESLGYFAPEAEDAGKPLVIPASAPLVTGRRAIVYVEVPEAPQPTFEGREVVLGPRAGGYYLVKHGLRAGELVVTRGNFTIDSEIQIRAKPSMMTPEGGGAGGMHHHGDGGEESKKAEGPQAAPMQVPVPFRKLLRRLDEAYRAVESAMESGRMERVQLAFRLFGESLEDVDAGLLEGHPRMLWDELRMLLSNDVAIGRDADDEEVARQAFESLTEHIRRMRKQLMAAGTGARHANH